MMLTPQQVASELQIQPNTVYLMLGKPLPSGIPASKIGRQWRVLRDDLDAFIDANRKGGRVRQENRRVVTTLLPSTRERRYRVPQKAA